MQETEEVTHAEKQLNRVRKALTVNPSAIIMILPDEAHRELAQAAFEKQHKNAVAAKGTMLALTKREDPTLDEIIESLSHLQQMAVNARPAEHQLDNTPIGKAIEEEQQRNGKKQQQRRGGEPQRVGDILAINWAEGVPEPRPKIGDRLRVPSGQTTSIEAVYGYQADLHVGDLVGAFEITDTTGWRGFVFAHNGEWRLVNAKDEYTDTEAAETPEATTTGAGEQQPDEQTTDLATTSTVDAGDASDPFSLAASREQERLEAGESETGMPDDVDRHTSMAGDLDDGEVASDEAITASFDADESEQPAAATGRKRAARVDRGKIGKGRKRSGGKKQR
jgi:hypothetical protein